MRVDQKTPEHQLRGLFLEWTLANLSEEEEFHLSIGYSPELVINNASLGCFIRC